MIVARMFDKIELEEENKWIVENNYATPDKE
ncbi:hypothetical protein J2Z65_002125 [Paenibacillus aceris]|uniref:Uncharacterized protein n=1 Tax=Paenibacillus aceris TaxID=869555 RepID=A0ABS4HW86_9BACL|nr:hypothetical protein [Paenibacillus aceris]